MALVGIRSTITRLVVMFGIAASLFAGTLAFGAQSDVSASTGRCNNYKVKAQTWQNQGDISYSQGDYDSANHHYAMANAYWDSYNDCMGGY